MACGTDGRMASSSGGSKWHDVCGYDARDRVVGKCGAGSIRRDVRCEDMMVKREAGVVRVSEGKEAWGEGWERGCVRVVREDGR